MTCEFQINPKDFIERLDLILGFFYSTSEQQGLDENSSIGPQLLTRCFPTL